MFYSTQILARRGPLALLWAACHMQEQLKRNQITGLDLLAAAEALLQPETPLALRLSGQLLLGLVRLYSKQLGYLHQDCQDTLVRLQLAFHEVNKPKSGTLHILDSQDVDLPPVNARPGAAGDDASWGLMVDMMEAQLLHDRPRLQGWPSADVSGWDGSQMPLAIRLQSAAKTPSNRKSDRRQSLSALKTALARGRTPGDAADTLTGRDQTRSKLAGAQTPAASRLGSQAESLFAAVASSGGIPASVRRQCSSQLPVAPLVTYAPWVGAADDEVFDEAPEGEDLGLDLLQDVEVEVLREAPNSAIRQARRASLLLGDRLAQLDSPTRHLLKEPLAGPSHVSPPTDTRSGAAAGPSRRSGSHQASQAGAGPLLSGLGGRGGSESGGGPLLDTTLDLAELLGAEPGLNDPLLASPRVEGSDGALEPGASPRLGAEGDEQQGEGARLVRASSRLQQAKAAHPGTQPEYASQGGRARAQAPTKRVRSAQGRQAVRHEGLLRGLLPRGPLPTDTAGPGSRKGAASTLLSAAECRAQLADTSALLTERGLAAYRRNKRVKVSPPTLNIASMAQPALGGTWGANLTQLMQHCYKAASPAQAAQAAAAAAAASPQQGPHSPGDVPMDTDPHPPPAIMTQPQDQQAAAQAEQQQPARPPLGEITLNSAGQAPGTAGKAGGKALPPQATPGSVRHGSRLGGDNNNDENAGPHQGDLDGTYPPPANDNDIPHASPMLHIDDLYMDDGTQGAGAFGGSQGGGSLQHRTPGGTQASPFALRGAGTGLQLGSARRLSGYPSGPGTAGGTSGSAGYLRSGSGPSSSQPDSGLSGQPLEARTERVLDAAFQMAVATLPSDLHTQLSQLAPASQATAARPGPSQLASQDVLSQIMAASEAVPLSQLVASQQTQGPKAPGARLQASRCFFDLLVLQSRGLVALQCGEKDAAAEPNGDLSVQMTQLGLSQRLATGLSQQ